MPNFTIDILSLFKSIVWDALVKSFIADGLAAIGLSIGGPFGVIVSVIITKFTDRFYKFMSLKVDIASIILLDSITKKSWENAQIKLKIIALESGVNSDAYKKAHKDEQDKFYSAIKFRHDPLVLRIGNGP